MSDKVNALIVEELDRIKAQNILQRLLLETMGEMKFEGALAGQIAERQKGIALNLELNEAYAKKVEALVSEVTVAEEVEG